MRRALLVLAALFLIVSTAAQAESGCLRIASVAEAPDVDFGTALGEELYREAGLCASVIRLPTERVKRMLDRGELDGVMLRSREFVVSHPGMVAAPTPLLTVNGRLYWRAGEAKPQGAGHKIAFPRGWVWPRLAVEKLGAEPVEVGDNRSLFKMAEARRIDGFIMVDYEFDSFRLSEAEGSQFAWSQIQPLPLYHAVTAAHAELVPALDAAIQRMVARGDVARLLGLRRPS